MRGAGTLFRRGRLWWLGYPTPTGYVRESSHGTDRAEALRLLHHRLRGLDTGAWQPAARSSTVASLLDVLVDTYRLEGKASLPAVLAHRHVLDPVLGRRRPAEVTYPGLVQLGQTWRAAGAAPATVNRRLATLRRAFTLGLRAGLVERVPPFPHLPEDNVRQGFVSQDELFRLLGAFTGPLRDLVAWMAYTGMRVGEAKALAWNHVDGAELRIPASLCKQRRARVLPLAGPLADVIASRAQDRTGLLLFHRDGAPIRDFRAAWRTACVRAGVPALLVHDLRRSAARNLIAAGVDEVVAQRILGHATASMFRRYRIVGTAEERAALERLGELMRRRG